MSSEDVPLTPIEKNWYPNVYRGGETDLDHVEEFSDSQEFLTAHDSPAAWRVKVISVVTNSSHNSTALEYVKKVYDHIKMGTENDSRIQYQTLCLLQEDDQVPISIFILFICCVGSMCNLFGELYLYCSYSHLRSWKIWFKCGSRAITPITWSTVPP